MAYVIFKSSRMPEAESYCGITWDKAQIRHLYKKVFENKIEAEVLARVLSAWNPVGFSVAEVKEKEFACPALEKRESDYPYGDKIPKEIVMLKTVTPDFPLSMIAGKKLKAVKGKKYKVWTNSHGAVSAIVPGGGKLGLKPDEFTVVEWYRYTQ